MTKRRMIIAAVGGDKQPDDFPFALGAAVARAGCILLTGGEPSDPAPEVKNLAPRGAIDAEAADGIKARLIGVIDSGKALARAGSRLPCLSPDLRLKDPHRLIFDSGLQHNIRNIINGVAPDAVIAFGGGPGTLAEIAFAAAAQRPIFFHAALDRLRANFKRDFGQYPHSKVERFLERPLQRFPSIKGRRWSSGELVALLGEILVQGDNTYQDATSLVARCVKAIDAQTTSKPTGFSDLPGDEETIWAFERAVAAMS